MPLYRPLAIAAVGSTPSANGGSVQGNILTLQPASATLPGVVTADTQSLGGAKTFVATPLLGTGAVSGAASSLGTVAALCHSVAAQDFPNGAATILRLDTVVVDTDGAVTTGVGWRFTAPAGKGGIYQLSVGFSFQNAGGAATRMQVGIYKGGAVYKGGVNEIPSLLPTVTYNMSAAAYLAPGEYLDVRVQPTSTGDIPARVGVDSNWINIVRIPGS